MMMGRLITLACFIAALQFNIVHANVNSNSGPTSNSESNEISSPKFKGVGKAGDGNDPSSPAFTFPHNNHRDTFTQPKQSRQQYHLLRHEDGGEDRNKWSWLNYSKPSSSSSTRSTSFSSRTTHGGDVDPVPNSQKMKDGGSGHVVGKAQKKMKDEKYEKSSNAWKQKVENEGAQAFEDDDAPPSSADKSKELTKYNGTAEEDNDDDEDADEDEEYYNKMLSLLTEAHQSRNAQDLNVITQAFKFVKLDTYLELVGEHVAKMGNSEEMIQTQFAKQDLKFDKMLKQVDDAVNRLMDEKSKTQQIGSSLETEMEKMNKRVDQLVQLVIQSTTNWQTQIQLSQDMMRMVDGMDKSTEEVLEEVKAVKDEVRDVGQLSTQAIYNIHKLEENFMLGLEQVGNRTVYALRQEVAAYSSGVGRNSKAIGPTTTQSLSRLQKEEGSPTHVQADEEKRESWSNNNHYYYYQQHSGGGERPAPNSSTSSSSSSRSVGGGDGIKAKSLVTCLSRKGLINEKRPRDCGEVQISMGTGRNLRSGVYTIFPSINSDHPTEVYCDVDTVGGGWTVIQKRADSKENFYRTWKEYANGFGSSQKQQYWLGLDNVAELTKFGDQELRIELVDWNGERRHASYSYFRVANISDKFRLHLADYSGSAGDSLLYHSGMMFSTRDQDNDLDNGLNCAERFQGAWWYKNCHQSNLNGVYMNTNNKGRHHSYGMGINWYSWHGYYYSLRQVEMKIRHRSFSSIEEAPSSSSPSSVK